MTKTFLRSSVVAALYGAILWTVTVASAAQQSAATNDTKSPRFEVASIKPNVSGASETGTVFQPGGWYRASNVRLRDLVSEAYRVRGFQVVGGPPWVSSDRFDIEAKAEDSTSFAPVWRADGTRAPNDTPFLMLRELLKERFKLVAHTETREGPIYALVMARADRARGPGLRPPKDNCARQDPRDPAPAIGLCSGIRRSPGRFEARTATMAQLATALSFSLQRPVIDRTNIAQPFDFDLEWKPIDPNVNVIDATSVIDFAPTLVVALEEQLGVKLDSQRGPVDYIVIDSAEPPAEN
jgi:uncharacterized protein (TIGR03435 family)